jgi:hypothetical protein
VNRVLHPGGSGSENDISREALSFDALVQLFPAPGSTLHVGNGEGMVVSRDLRHGTIAIRMFNSGETVSLPIMKQG